MATTRRPLMGRTGRGAASTDLARDLTYGYRRKMGAWFQDQRIKAGMTQAQVGNSLGIWATAVSSIEMGRNSISPELYEPICSLFGLDRAEFGKMILRHYDPQLYACIYGTCEKALKEDLQRLGNRFSTRRDGAEGGPNPQI